MDAAAAGFDADRVLEVQHLVIQQVLDGVARSPGAVEDPADHDGIVGGIVVAEHALRYVGGPGQRGAAQEAMKKTRVEGFEDFVEVELVSLRRGEALAAAGLADALGLLGDDFGLRVAAVPIVVVPLDGLAVELGQQDVSDGFVDGFRGVLKQVGEAHVELAFAEADGRIQRGETPEADVERRHRGARTEVAVRHFKNGDQGGRDGG